MKEVIKKYLEETMVHVEGGEFMMGSDEFKREKPTHKVKLSTFELNKYPVTQEFYKWVMGENPSHFRGKQRPVEQIDWYDALVFCNTLSALFEIEKFYWIKKNNSEKKKDWNIEVREGSLGIRLPTEAEWEYAAKGGKYWKAKFENSGSNLLKNVGWYSENSHHESKEVGLKKSNQLGLYDLSGNIDEWCWDRFGEYKNNMEENPMGPELGDSRVVRGGSWYNYAYLSRVTYRNVNDPSVGLKDISFRISKGV